MSANSRGCCSPAPCQNWLPPLTAARNDGIEVALRLSRFGLLGRVSPAPAPAAVPELTSSTPTAGSRPPSVLAAEYAGLSTGPAQSRHAAAAALGPTATCSTDQRNERLGAQLRSAPTWHCRPPAFPCGFGPGRPGRQRNRRHSDFTKSALPASVTPASLPVTSALGQGASSPGSVTMAPCTRLPPVSTPR